MSYTNAPVAPADRAKAVATVIGLHALLGVGLVTGLAVSTDLLDQDDELGAIEIPLDPPPPPPDPVDTPPDAQVPNTPPAAPPPPIPIPRNNPIDTVPPRDLPPITTRTVPDTPPLPAPPAAEPPVVPTPAFTPTSASPRNATRNWITTDDYSRRDLARGNEGTARYRLVIGSNGRVDACEVTASTGHVTLDQATCRLITQRARFNPATNNRGENTVGTYTGSVTWQIPE